MGKLIYMFIASGNKKIFALLILPSLLLFSILLLFGENFTLSITAAIFYSLFLVAFLKPRTGLLLIIFLRPCLDYFTKNNLNVIGLEINPAGVFAGLTIIFSISVLIQYREKIKANAIIIAWIAFIISMLISLPLSMNAASSFEEVIRLTSIFLIFLTAFTLTENNKDLSKLIKVLIASAVIPSAMAVWQYFTKTGLTIPLEGVYNRVYGTFAHPNLLAFYLLMAITLCFLIFLSSDKKKVSILIFGLLAMFFLITLGFTYTRSAWLGLLLVVLLLGVSRYRLFLVVSLGVILISFFSVEAINQRIHAFTSNDPGNSINWRIGLWKDGASYAMYKPITGYGAGTSKELILKKRGPEAGSSDAHNDYLRVMLEAGVIGLLAYCSLLLALLKSVFDLYKQQVRPRLKSLNFACLAMLVGFAIISFGDNILANTALQWALWSLVGGLLAKKA
jgi:O-antigen ligase